MRLLVALDLRTEGHDWLLGQAARVGEMAGALLDLMFVRTPGLSPSVSEQEAQERLDAMMQKVPKDRRGSSVSPVGELVDVLTEASKKYDALVVGPREPGALERLFKGTIATRVMRAAHCPVVIPRHEGRKPESTPRCLVGADLTKDNYPWVISQAGAWTVALRGTLDVVFVGSSSSASGIRNARIREQAMRELEAARAPERRAMQKVLDTLPASARGQTLVESGEVERTLISLTENYDFILVGNIERSGIAGYLLGTVASCVVRQSHCDVVTLPAASHLEQAQNTQDAG